MVKHNKKWFVSGRTVRVHDKMQTNYTYKLTYACGTNLKNSWPVVTGVIICAFIFDINLSDPGPILAIIFVTTLGPLAGEFGWRVGIVAGIIHLALVMQTGSWHGGMNLYNNGFAGGLTAALIVAVIQWYKTNKTEFKDTFRSKKR